MAHRSPGRRGTDGVLELHLAFDHLRAGLLCTGPAVVRAAAAVSALLHRARDVDPQPGHQPDLAALFPLRTARVVLALTDLLAASADAPPRAGRGRRVRVGIGGPQPSSRSACEGSMRAALLAGRYVASRLTPSRTVATETNVTGSLADTWNSSDSIRRVDAQAATSPTTIPAIV